MDFRIAVLLLVLFGSIKVSIGISYSHDVAARDFLENLKATRYNPRVPPPTGTALKVFSSLHIIDIDEFNDNRMEYRAQLYFRQLWNDTRLKYISKDIRYLSLKEMDDIWTPDMFFVEEKDGKHHQLMTPNTFLRIRPNGEVFRSDRITIILSCPMNFRKYPHDSQECSFHIESYGYTKNQLELEWHSKNDGNPVTVSDSTSLKLVELTGVSHSVKTIGVNTNNYTALQIHLSFQRKSGFMALKLYVPFFFLIFTSWIAFWIKPQLMAMRLMLLVVILYLAVNVIDNVNLYAPPTSYIKASDIWVGFGIFLLCAALFENILVSSFVYKEKNCLSLSRNDEEQAPKNSLSLEKTETMDSSFNFVARSLCKDIRWSMRTDRFSRVLFPIIFLLFNIVYWPVVNN